eukprot:6008393-Amphidinium_carterae.1
MRIKSYPMDRSPSARLQPPGLQVQTRGPGQSRGWWKSIKNLRVLLQVRHTHRHPRRQQRQPQHRGEFTVVAGSPGPPLSPLSGTLELLAVAVEQQKRSLATACAGPKEPRPQRNATEILPEGQFLEWVPALLAAPSLGPCLSLIGNKQHQPLEESDYRLFRVAALPQACCPTASVALRAAS